MSDLTKKTTRTITLVSTMSSGATKYENVQVETVADLKAVLGHNTVNNMNIAGLDTNRGKHSFQFDETVLPTGDLAIFLSPAKQRGALDLETASYNALRAYVKEHKLVGGGANPTKADLIKLIKSQEKTLLPEKPKKVDRVKVKETIVKDVVKKEKEVKSPVAERTNHWKDKFKEFVKTAKDLKDTLDPKLQDNQLAIARIEKSNAEMSSALTIIDSVLDYTKDQEILNETPSNAIPLASVVESVQQHKAAESTPLEELEAEEEEDEDLEDEEDSDDDSEEDEDEEIETPSPQPSTDPFAGLSANDIKGMFK